jgi:hypothetical protein
MIERKYNSALLFCIIRLRNDRIYAYLGCNNKYYDKELDVTDTLLTLIGILLSKGFVRVGRYYVKLNEVTYIVLVDRVFLKFRGGRILRLNNKSAWQKYIEDSKFSIDISEKIEKFYTT